MKQRIAPLSGGVMIVGMFGFLIAIMFLKNYSLNWAVIVGTVSAIMFVASMISVTNAPVEEDLLLDEHNSERKRRVKVYTLKEYKEHELLMKEKHKKELAALKEAMPKTKKNIKIHSNKIVNALKQKKSIPITKKK